MTCKLVFNRFKSLPCIFCTNQTKQNVCLNVHKSQRTKETKITFQLEYAFLIQIGLIIFLFFCHLSSLFQVEVFEAIQHILMTRTGWKIRKHVKDCGLSSTCDVISFDQNLHHLYSTSAGGKDLSNNTQIKVIGLMEPEICTKMLKKLSEKLEQNFLPLHVAIRCLKLPVLMMLSQRFFNCK